eukprot:1031198-Prorocentrum_minimum.AAC.1
MPTSRHIIHTLHTPILTFVYSSSRGASPHLANAIHQPSVSEPPHDCMSACIMYTHLTRLDQSGEGHPVGHAAALITTDLNHLLEACGARCNKGCFHGARRPPAYH